MGIFDKINQLKFELQQALDLIAVKDLIIKDKDEKIMELKIIIRELKEAK